MKRIIYIVPVLLAFISFSCGSTTPVTQQNSKNMTQTDINKMPASQPAPKIKFKKPEVFKLPNGLTVIVVENHKLPRVNASLRLDNPPAQLGKKKGTDDLLSSMLGTGSQSVSKEKFNSRIDFLGANVSLHNGGFYINSLSKYFDEILQLTADQALHPKFSEEEFKTQQEKLIENLKSEEKSTPAAARRVMKKLGYGKHPYGEITLIENVKNITLRDVDNFYREEFIPNRAYLIIVGDVDAEKAKAMAENYFGKWKKIPNLHYPRYPSIKNVEKTEVDFVHMPNAEQTELKFVHRSDVLRRNPDYQKVLLMNSILGGDFNSYLNMTLREEHGWTYGARSRFGTDKYGDLFTASTSVRNSVADSAVVVSMEQINKIINEKVSDTLLYNNKQKYMGNFVLNMEKPSTIANQAYRIFVDNLPEDYYETFLQKIDAVTVDDIQAVARKYLYPDHMRIIVAGNATTTVPGLEKAGYPIKYFDKYGNPARAPKMNQKIPDGVNTSSVIDNYLEAIGVKNKIKNIQSLETVYTTQMQGMELTKTSKAMAPNLSADIMSGMGMVLMKEVFDGTKGYKESRGQKMEFTPEEIKKYKNTPQPFSVIKLKKTGKLDRIESIDGKDFYVIIDTDEGTELFFNTKTGLKEKEVQHKKVQGREMTQPILFSDYKEINGIKFPAKVTIVTGVQNMEFKLKDAKVNTLTKADFK